MTPSSHKSRGKFTTKINDKDVKTAFYPEKTPNSTSYIARILHQVYRYNIHVIHVQIQKRLQYGGTSEYYIFLDIYIYI